MWQVGFEAIYYVHGSVVSPENIANTCHVTACHSGSCDSFFVQNCLLSRSLFECGLYDIFVITSRGVMRHLQIKENLSAELFRYANNLNVDMTECKHLGYINID